jgi:hypothetical protein
MASAKEDPQEVPSFKITVTKNGPYLVSGRLPLSEQRICVDSEGQPHGWEEGKNLPAPKGYSLCRCGHSRSSSIIGGGCDDVRSAGTPARMLPSGGKEAGGFLPYSQHVSRPAHGSVKTVHNHKTPLDWDEDGKRATIESQTN